MYFCLTIDSIKKAIHNSLKVNKAALKLSDNATELVDIIVDSISDKKGEEIVSIDLRKVEDAVADFFVICHASTGIQIKSIAEHIESQVWTKLGERPWRKEGKQNLEWVLLDYVNVVVHIFLKSKRSFYQLEELWSDGVLTDYED